MCVDGAIISNTHTQKWNLFSPGSTDVVPTIPALSKNQELFNKRNMVVATAGQAGKSRWGPLEIAKAVQQTSSTTPLLPFGSVVPQKVEHKRSPTLSERVNLGAQLMSQS
mmetsp:Transcript_10367/g.24007  ORF Transcript_10367/g.24007 Transcript_10367/m.24007 type:complete len:110 (-) Transcript_10367:94-423(-)